jgi:23S rRNA (guanosine2251-2'-O)-methyltransferase
MSRKPFPGRRAQAGRPHPRGERQSGDTVLLFGWHPVSEAFKNPRRTFLRLQATQNAAQRLADEVGALPITAEIVRPEQLAAQLPADAVHQGLLLIATALPALDIEDLRPEGVVLVLDQITDPHNVGAILRTATAFAVQAVVTTGRNSPELTGVLAKSASGGLEHTPLVTVGNLARALEQLADLGFHRVGLDSEAPADLASLDLSGPLVLVLGAEGQGMRRLTRDKCDVLARMDLPGAIKSLNVSNAAVLALYLATRGR